MTSFYPSLTLLPSTWECLHMCSCFWDLPSPDTPMADILGVWNWHTNINRHKESLWLLSEHKNLAPSLQSSAPEACSLSTWYVPRPVICFFVAHFRSYVPSSQRAQWLHDLPLHFRHPEQSWPIGQKVCLNLIMIFYMETAYREKTKNANIFKNCL